MTGEEQLIAGRYRLIAKIGSGGMGVVWRAKDEVLGRTVAVKALMVAPMVGPPEDDERVRRAMREARIAARLHHPNVIGIYDVVDHDGRPFLVMEYLESSSLSETLAEGTHLTVEAAARIGAQVASALAAAHDAGIVHRDVKPGNVLRAEDGTVKLTDFGISRAVGDTTVTASGVLLGTLSYIAPEVARGQSADARSDVYALGATLYAALEGEPPSGTGDNAIAQLYRIVHEDIATPSNAGPLTPILMWMLERDPDLRPTMQQVQRALEEIENAPSEPATAQLPAEPEDEPPAPVDTSAAADAPAPPPAPPRVSPRRGLAALGKRRTLIAAITAPVLVIAGVVALITQTGNHATGGSPAASGSTGASASRSATPVILPSLSASPSPSTNRGAGGQGTASAPASTAASTQDRATQLTSTIIDYYKLMPGGVDQGWNWMTADYQTNHAGGRSGYTSFWARIQSVSVSNVTAQLPSTVVATIHYGYRDGSTVVERTSFGLVFQQNQWKIASSVVLSSGGG
ncbi:MAG TPA: serine/threonine-protein kinase [Actinocrinis sp.]|nr:serine/threonine-protein kinase [Actinocrinis sp.]